MAFGYYASLFPWQNKKVKTIYVTFLSHNSDFYIGIASLNLAIQTLSELWDTVNSQLQEEIKSEIKSQLPFTLYIPWQKYVSYGFTLCKGKKQTNIKNAQSNAHSLLSLTSS